MFESGLTVYSTQVRRTNHSFQRTMNPSSALHHNLINGIFVLLNINSKLLFVITLKILIRVGRLECQIFED